MALPTASTPGYTLFKHASGSFVACECLAKWLPVLERLAKAHGYIKYNLDILQLTGNYALSAGNHSQGGTFDIKQYDKRIVALAREMGAPATWLRDMLYADGSPGNTHTHGVLTGCPHNSPSRYQIDAQKAGYDGMGYMGRKGPDPHPDPAVYRTWTQGIAWALSELDRLEDPLAGYTLDQIAAAVWSYQIKHPHPEKPPIAASVSQWSTNFYAWKGYEQALAAAKAAGADVDETALAASLASTLMPQIIAAVREAVPAELADSVIDKIGQRLTAPAAG